jgi:hypothetical protein
MLLKQENRGAANSDAMASHSWSSKDSKTGYSRQMTISSIVWEEMVERMVGKHLATLVTPG